MKRALFGKGLLIIMLLALVVVQGCGEKEKPQGKAATMSKEDIKKEVKEAYDATKAYTKEQVQAFRQETETKLDDYRKDIDQLQAKVERLEGNAKTNAAQKLTALRQKRDEVSKKLMNLSSSSGNAWEQIKSSIDAAMEDLGDAYKKIAAEFSKN
ncbi:MAG: hypothetical protein P8X55_00815 [Desulfosarcinaceae bacterium]